MRNLLNAARETVDVTIPAEPIPELQDLDLMQAQGETGELALEFFRHRVATLENLAEAIKDVPESKATPELIATIQATLLADDIEDPVVSQERDDSAGSWDKTKSYASKTLDAFKAGAKEAIKSLLDLLDRLVNFVVTTRKGLERSLTNLRGQLAKAGQVAEIKFTRDLIPLTVGSAFDARTAADVQKRYAQVLAAGVYAIDEVYNNTESMLRPNYKPTALRDMAGHFQERTQGGIDWEGSTGKVYEGEGGMHVTVTVSGTRMVINSDATNDPADIGSTSAVATSFNRSEVDGLIKQAQTLLKGIEQLEPKIDKVRSSMRRAFAADAALNALGAYYHTQGIKGTSMFMYLRPYVNFASTYGVGAAMKGARATAKLAEAFIKGGIKQEADAPDAPISGEIIGQRALPA